MKERIKEKYDVELGQEEIIYMDKWDSVYFKIYGNIYFMDSDYDFWSPSMMSKEEIESIILSENTNKELRKALHKASHYKIELESIYKLENEIKEKEDKIFNYKINEYFIEPKRYTMEVVCKIEHTFEPTSIDITMFGASTRIAMPSMPEQPDWIIKEDLEDKIVIEQDDKLILLNKLYGNRYSQTFVYNKEKQ